MFKQKADFTEFWKRIITKAVILFFFLGGCRGIALMKTNWCRKDKQLVHRSYLTHFVTFQKYQVPVMNGFDWVLLKKITEKKSQWRSQGPSVQFLAPPTFHAYSCKTKTLTIFNKCAENPEAFINRWTGKLTPTVWHILRNSSIGKQSSNPIGCFWAENPKVFINR